MASLKQPACAAMHPILANGDVSLWGTYLITSPHGNVIVLAHLGSGSFLQRGSPTPTSLATAALVL
ncbi:MAG: hypothetical protein JWM16_6010 [Verrucomicrobiales bacterium]|nr:hypothetical protein [Verrucomicrobiales bacterium]